jgi:hypothetical protein
VESTDNSLIMLLKHVPTPPVSDTYPPFTVAEMPLQEWLEYDDNEEGMEDLHLSERAQTAMDWETVLHKVDSSADGLSSQKINSMMMGNNIQTTKTIDIDLVKDLTGLIDPPEPITKVWPPTPLYPLAPVYYPTLTLTDYALLVGTPDIRLHLIHTIGEQRIASLKALIKSCEQEVNAWQKRLDLLVYQKQILDDLVPLAGEHIAGLKDTAKRTDDLTKEIAERKLDYPAVAHILDIKTAAYKKHQGSPIIPNRAQSRPMNQRSTSLATNQTPQHSLSIPSGFRYIVPSIN